MEADHDFEIQIQTVLKIAQTLATGVDLSIFNSSEQSK